MQDIETRFNQVDDSAGEMTLPDDIEVFKHGVTLVGATRRQYIDDDVLKKLNWYVLNNCEEVDEFKE
jgi:hypothetical protein